MFISSLSPSGDLQYNCCHLKNLTAQTFFHFYRYVDLLRFGVCSWSEKRRIEERKEGGTFWPGTTLPSLSTTLPRPRYLATDGLPAFETAATTATSSCTNTSGSSPPTSASSRPSPNPTPVDYYMLTVYEDRDSSLLSLFRALLQCSLQLVLQLYSLLHHYQLEHVHNHSSEYNHQFTGKLKENF